MQSYLESILPGVSLMLGHYLYAKALDISVELLIAYELALFALTFGI